MFDEYLLYCNCCNEYTFLGKYLEAEGHFQGEYSLLHNRHLNSDDMLCRFLLRHVGHPLRPHSVGTDDYSRILSKAERFMDMDIDSFAEMQIDRSRRRGHEIQIERGLGQLQLYILKELLEKEALSVSQLPAQSPAQSQFLLGKEEGLKRAQELLKELIENTKIYYNSFS